MTAVMDNNLTPKIHKEISEIPQEIINNDNYLDYVWLSKTLNHHQKMVMLYLSGISESWTTISEISINTRLQLMTTEKTLTNLVINKYIESKEISKDKNIEWHTSFTFTITKKIVDEYLSSLINSSNFTKINLKNQSQ